MVNTSALESRGRGFKSRSRQFLEFHLCSFISFFHWFQFICVIYIYIYIHTHTRALPVFKPVWPEKNQGACRLPRCQVTVRAVPGLSSCIDQEVKPPTFLGTGLAWSRPARCCCCCCCFSFFKPVFRPWFLYGPLACPFPTPKSTAYLKKSLCKSKHGSRHD